LSDDVTFGDADDVKIGDAGFTVSISNGGTYPITLSSLGLSNMVRFWPEDHPCGDFYVFASVIIVNPPPTDPNSSNDYDGTNSTINYTGCPPGADLALTNLTVSPSSVSTREFTSCSFDIVNNGPLDLSSEYIQVDFYLSDDVTFGDADDVKIGDAGFTVSISNGGTYPINLSSLGLSNMVRFWPEDHPCGDFYVFASVIIVNPPPIDPNSSNDYDGTNSTINYSGCPIDVNEEISEELPDGYFLMPNYPNPFNAVTNIKFVLPRSSDVMIEIFNVLGQRVKMLVNERLSTGFKSVVWDGRDENGLEVSSGLYFYRITANDFIQTKKMLLLK